MPSLAALDRSRLILAYGRHWRRDEVDWGHGSKWQMLGRIGDRRPNLRVCDWRIARGVYVLEKYKRPTYVGIARGTSGLGARLTQHHKDPEKNWTTFSFFSFDGVVDTGTRAEPLGEGWARIKDRDTLYASPVNDRIGEVEALMVGLLGATLTNKQKPRFGTAVEWTQVTSRDFGSRGVGRRVDAAHFLGQYAHLVQL